MTDSPHRLNPSLSEASFKLSCDSVLSKLVPPEKSLIDSILAHDDSQQPEIVLPDGQKFIWYLAIGSMMNPISLYLRDLIPLKSYPATCVDHKVVFRHPSGMADIENCEGAQFDAVVHLLTEEQMKILDGLEMGYNRIKVKCIDYENQSHIVYAYQMKFLKQPAGIPHERYLDIITKGCEYYKVRPEYIKRLKEEQPVTPRTRPDSFKSFTDIPSDVYYSLEELEKHNGSDPSLPPWLCINGKILEYAGIPPPDHPDHDFHRHFNTIFKEKYAGREMAPIMARALYEPLYKLPLNDDDICEEHRAQIEDYYCNSFAGERNKNFWEPIGRLRSSNK